MSILDWKQDPDLACDDEDCDFKTSDVKEAMAHAAQTGHSISGPGVIEGTTLTVSLVLDEDEEDEL